MQTNVVLYHTATAVNCGAFSTSMVASFSNAIHASPKDEQTAFIGLAAVGTCLRLPVVLSPQGTTRERVLYLGYTVLEGVSIVCNVLAYRRRHRSAVPAAMAIAVAMCAALTVQIQRFGSPIK